MDRTVTVLDGGMGKLLERNGAPFRQPEWSALALLEAPEAVQRAHLGFIDAGADVITVNAYAVVPFHLGDARFAERGAELAALAGRLARRAAGQAERHVQVAGSLPPLFGSYEPDLFRPADAPDLLDVLVAAQAPFVDLWLAETVSSIAEAHAVAAAVHRHDPDATLWLSFTVPDEPPGNEVGLRSGESIADAVEAIGTQAAAILFNCSPPEAIDGALRHLDDALGDNPHGVRTGAYANAFVPKTSDYAANEVVLGARAELTPERYRDQCLEWIERGATIIGGCCHMYPEHIGAITRAIR